MDEQQKIGTALRSAAIARIIAQANAVYYTELILQGIEPALAERMTFNATQQIFTGGAELITACVQIAEHLPPIVRAIEGMIETPAVEALLKGLLDDVRAEPQP